MGCPFVPNETEYLARMATRRVSIRQNIERYGAEYVRRKPKKGQTPAQVLAEVLKDESESANKFRDTWYAEKRRAVLDAEGMGWAFDVVYKRLCSAVHSDAAASRVWGTVTRDGWVTKALWWWGAAVYRLADTFRLRLSAEHMGALRSDYESLQGRRKGRP